MAGVSRATVSYVLNGVTHQRVSAATRAHVLSVAARMGYAPNAAARLLRTGRSDIVLLAVQPWPHGPVMVQAIDTAVGDLSRLGYTPLAHFEQPQLSSALPQACHRIQPVGFIGPAERLTPKFIRQLQAGGTKAIVAIGQTPHRTVPTVVVVQADFGRAAMDYLAHQGHQRVLAVMPADPALSELRDSRLLGAQQAARRDGTRLSVIDSPLDLSQVTSALTHQLESRRPPTAIYTFNDDYAFLVMRALLDLGCTVPDDVAVIGCDDVAPAAVFRPALTTVRIDGTAFGAQMARLLHACLVDAKPPRSVQLDPPVVVARESA
jgi:DNA-binding LacI/PurR family transcriptional regulator